MSRLKGKLVMSSRWLYKINHVAYGSIEKFKDKFHGERVIPKIGSSL